MKKVDVYDLGAKIGKVGYKRSWVNYKFGNGYGQAMEGTTIRTVNPSRGYIFNNQPTLTVRGFVRAFNERDWERLACFYGGVTAFCLSEDVVIFSDDVKRLHLKNIPDEERAPDEVFPKTIFSNSKLSLGNKNLYKSLILNIPTLVINVNCIISFSVTSPVLTFLNLIVFKFGSNIIVLFGDVISFDDVTYT